MHNYNSDDEDDEIRPPDQIRNERLIESPILDPINQRILDESLAEYTTAELLKTTREEYEREEEKIIEESLREYMKIEEQKFIIKQQERATLMEPLMNRLAKIKLQKPAYNIFYEIIKEYTAGIKDDFTVDALSYIEITNLLESLYKSPLLRGKQPAISEDTYNQCLSMIMYE
jgi:hypothetical protein